MEEQTQVPAPTAAAPPPNVEHDVALEDKTALNMEIVKEFQYLLQKSQQLFAGLRAVLENKDYYGLKRVEIGECASKIGQLYYHYYLRTSETNYLYESYVFYEAIRDRQYFKDVLDSKTPALMIKKLRYYARFIVVCLLLNRNDMIKKLMEELTALVDEYTKVFKPNDAAEWNVVLSEISTFLEAEKKLTPVDFEGTLLTAPNRVQVERSSKFDKDGLPKLKLQEAILVGNFQNQIKFSELTLDMYRILQSLEREPTSPTSKSQQPPMAAPPDAADAPPAAMTSSADDTAATSVGMESSSSTTNPGSATAAATAGADKVTTRRSNPHKYLLYRPTFAQLMLYVATAFKDITDNSALLLYLSADGSKRNVKGDHVDVVPFTRKPLFVIVDSTNSTAFKVRLII
ncbi:hypothetical protein HK102_008982 [Quaeritorhiza haematococci]|nr:hypothetical protein HK102_008982 [Quaeritorhiza haematococci]